MVRDLDRSRDRHPAISIVMPYRDAEATIVRAVASVRNQTFGNWELLAVNDHSTDRSPAILAELAAMDPRIQRLESRERGLVAALNTGCEFARGEFIARFDADDECLPHRLERQLDWARSHDDLGVIGSLVDFGGERATAEGYARHVDWANALTDHEAIVSERFIDSPLPHPSVMFPREVLLEHGGYREGDFPEDHELWLRWIDAGVRFGKVPEVLLRWNDPPHRLSRRDRRYSIDATARLRCRHLAIDLARRGEQRPLWLWGAGRITRRRFDALCEHGLDIAGFIDIDPDRIGQKALGRPVVSASELPPREDSFIVSGVGVRGAREVIRELLRASGRREVDDFLIAG